MFFIMGIQDREKIHNHMNRDFPCHVCDGQEGYRVYEWCNIFHIFFIPLWKWGHTYRYQCMSCNSLYTMKKSDGENTKEIIENPTYWNLKLVEMKKRGQSAVQCVQCGFELSTGFVYCPKCGNKIKNT